MRNKDLYFIQCGNDGPIKIGISSNTDKRLFELEPFSPYELRILKIVKNGGQGLERKLHKKFADLRLKNEWFEPDKKLLEYIKNLKTQPKRSIVKSVEEQINSAEIQIIANKAIERYERTIHHDIKEGMGCKDIVKKWHVGPKQYHRIKNRFK